MEEKKMPVDDKGDEVYNGNGIRIIAKGLTEDSSDYSDDVHMLFLIENNSADIIEVDDSYDSLSVNGYMTGYLSGSRKIPASQYGMVDAFILWQFVIVLTQMLEQYRI